MFNFLATNKYGQKERAIDSAKKLNMLIFWASLCGPCRQEIPQLKELYHKYGKQKISITSISIDSEKAAWQYALQMENMPWKQLLVDSNQIEYILAKYSFSTIPQIFFIDGNCKQLKRFSDFNPENEKLIDSFISNFMASKN